MNYVSEIIQYIIEFIVPIYNNSYLCGQLVSHQLLIYDRDIKNIVEHKKCGKKCYSAQIKYEVLNVFQSEKLMNYEYI